jgi:beta-glucosidase
MIKRTFLLIYLGVCLLVAPLPVAGQPPAAYRNPALPVEARIDDLLPRMTLPEKIGQMTLIEKNSVRPADVTAKFLGGVLSGGGGSPRPNTAEAWAKMVDDYQRAALATRLAIPILYGVDAVHGHGNLYGATIFPHNIGLGAANDPDLVERIGRATAQEMIATGIYWNYSPVLAVVQDYRWGRAYESFGERTEWVTALGLAMLRGLQGEKLGAPGTVLATPKHYVADGGTAWGSSSTEDYQIDQGVAEIDEATLRRIHLPPYQAAVQAGALSVMASFSSWGGLKMHAQKYLLTDVLKGELGFTGFIVSDWGGIDQIAEDYDQAVITAINAGIDMNMVPYDADKFINALTRAVGSGAVPMARIDDAVRRILRAKFTLGLFERPFSDPALLPTVGSAEHRALAREAVGKSLVLLKNADQTLPLAPTTPTIFVAGMAADDIGIQSGGWTIEWQGKTGRITPGTTILEGITAAVGPETKVMYSALGRFGSQKAADGSALIADVGVVVVGEKPYAEGKGDSAALTLSDPDQALISRVRPVSKKLVVIVVSGRPLALGEALDQADAVIAAWLPGTEGAGVADGLFGVRPFTGKLPVTWLKSPDQLPFNFATDCAEAAFAFGYGLSATDPTVGVPPCPVVPFKR